MWSYWCQRASHSPLRTPPAETPNTAGPEVAPRPQARQGVLPFAPRDARCPSAGASLRLRCEDTPQADKAAGQRGRTFSEQTRIGEQTASDDPVGGAHRRSHEDEAHQDGEKRNHGRPSRVIKDGGAPLAPPPSQPAEPIPLSSLLCRKNGARTRDRSFFPGAGQVREHTWVKSGSVASGGTSFSVDRGASSSPDGSGRCRCQARRGRPIGGQGVGLRKHCRELDRGTSVGRAPGAHTGLSGQRGNLIDDAPVSERRGIVTCANGGGVGQAAQGGVVRPWWQLRTSAPLTTRVRSGAHLSANHWACL